MRKPLAFTLALFVASLFTAAVSLGQQGDRPQISNGPQIRALVYHETTGFRHASIPYEIEQLRAYGTRTASTSPRIRRPRSLPTPAWRTTTSSSG